MSEQEITLDLHAIQATRIGVRELYIQSKVVPSPTISMDLGCFKLKHGRSDYDSESHLISARVTVEAGMEDAEEGLPYALRVSLEAQFIVDEAKFPAEHIEQWAMNNAIFIVYPYVREHVYALTIRAGFAPALLPLAEIPTYQIPRG